MTATFKVQTLYTWKRNNDAFRTASLFKDGKPDGRMSAADANAWCEKWNGRRGDFEAR